GVPVRMIGKIGDDLFGKAIQDIIRREGVTLAEDLVVDPGASTAFTIILNPPGFDRSFLHFAGANQTFYASDLSRATLNEAALFHFGYPSLMRSIYRGEGGELVSILQRARRAGLTTSLDYSMPDLHSPAGKVDWPLVLANSLPYVDLFLPSVEELTYLLQPETFNAMNENPHISFMEAISPELLTALSQRVLAYGVKAVMIKLGHRGIYLRTASAEVWDKGGRALEGMSTSWFNRELWVPAFEVDVRGSTGAGDAAVAGFLASLLKGKDPETALILAAAAGACSVEQPDAISGLSIGDTVLARIKGGWSTQPLDLTAAGWQWDKTNGFWEKV
ncbi:MAG: carbohydrate kinase family protein, partial [Anaerolineales bacterium]